MSVRDGLLDTAIEVLLADPSASLGDVASAAGVGRTTLHKRFPTRRDLLLALAHDAVDRVDKALAEARVDVPGEQAPAALRRLTELLIPLGPRVEFLYRQHSLDDEPELLARYEELERPLRELVERGQAAGTLRHDLPAWWVVHMLDGVVYQAWEAVSSGRLARLDAPDLVLSTVLTGIGARP